MHDCMSTHNLLFSPDLSDFSEKALNGGNSGQLYSLSLII